MMPSFGRKALGWVPACPACDGSRKIDYVDSRVLQLAVFMALESFPFRVYSTARLGWMAGLGQQADIKPDSMALKCCLSPPRRHIHLSIEILQSRFTSGPLISGLLLLSELPKVWHVEALVAPAVMLCVVTTSRWGKRAVGGDNAMTCGLIEKGF